MAVPDFVLELRRSIGNAPLWLSGVTAVVLRDDEILLVRRADTLAWTPVTGIIDPGEEPAVAAAREAAEEAGVEIAVERLAGVGVTPVVTYDNGDVTQYLDLTFRCRWLSGDPHPADGENVAAAWFRLDALPPMSDDFLGRIAPAVADEPAARFRTR